MSCSKRKRTTEKHELQLPIERRQHIQNLFEKKFTYRNPHDGSWTLPNKNCTLETSDLLANGNKNHEVSHQSAQINSLTQSDSSKQSCDAKEDISDELSQSCDNNMDQLQHPDDLSNGRNHVSKVLNSLWTVDEYIKMKTELNDLKNNLNDKDMICWHQHTRSLNLAANIAMEIQQNFRPELCTQAWCKFYEMASVYLSILDKDYICSVHLCEAPGAFVTSLNHFMLSIGYEGDWDWIATTLNPYYEGNNIGHMINDDRFIRRTEENWYFGVDNTGDLMSWRNLEGLKALLGDKRVNLVTADGSIDCQGDPAEQEDVVSRLQHCETLAALEILSPGGDFIIKMFTVLECKAVCLMYLINCLFGEVHVFKPCTSKGGNSEVYVIGLQYKGSDNREYLKQLISVYFGTSETDECLFSKIQIPSSFLTQHTECASFFKELQMASIQRNLDLYKELSDTAKESLEAEKQFCTECFFQRYYMVPMVHQWRVMKYKKQPQNQRTAEAKVSKFEKIASSRKNEGRFCGSFEARQLQSGLPWKQKVMGYDTYKVSEPEFVTWAENQLGPLDSSELCQCHSTFGQPVNKIESSRFCYGRLIQQAQEIMHNVAWLSHEIQVNKDLLETKVKKMLAILADFYLTRTVERKEGKLNIHHDINTFSNVTGVSDQGKIVTVDSLVETPAAKKSPLLCALRDQLIQPPTSSTTTINSVQLYNLCCYTLDKNFELNEQTELLNAVRYILETCECGGAVIIEMRSCLTRLTAGLIYILYRCFNKLALVNYRGDLLRQYLVCLHYNLCLSVLEVRDYLTAIGSTQNSETDFSLLELVPVSILIDDPQFCSFLQTSNTQLIQSFVTTVVEKERTVLTQTTELT